jgi:hypothetical protein
MRFLKAIGRWIWRFMVIFSFIVNIVLVVVLIGLGLFIFEIKNNIAQPLVGGLHSTAVGLENATIDWTIPVRDNIPVVLNIPLQTDTVVRLTQPVPLQVNATIDLPGINAYGVNANVNLQLPAGLELPVALDLMVPVNERLDVALDVRAVIPLAQTQLADPINQLALLFEPLAIGLHNLPSSFDQAGVLIQRVLNRESINLLSTDGTGGVNQQPYVPWAGYSQTAGLNYTLLNQPVPSQNLPILTGFVPLGGIPALDSQLPERAALYANSSTPLLNNQQAQENLSNAGIAPQFFDGTMSQFYNVMQGAPLLGGAPVETTNNTSTEPQIDPITNLPVTPPPAVGGETNVQPTLVTDFGIIATPSGSP